MPRIATVSETKIFEAIINDFGGFEIDHQEDDLYKISYRLEQLEIFADYDKSAMALSNIEVNDYETDEPDLTIYEDLQEILIDQLSDALSFSEPFEPTRDLNIKTQYGLN